MGFKRNKSTGSLQVELSRLNDSKAMILAAEPYPLNLTGSRRTAKLDLSGIARLLEIESGHFEDQSGLENPAFMGQNYLEKSNRRFRRDSRENRAFADKACESSMALELPFELEPGLEPELELGRRGRQLRSSLSSPILPDLLPSSEKHQRQSKQRRQQQQQQHHHQIPTERQNMIMNETASKIGGKPKKKATTEPLVASSTRSMNNLNSTGEMETSPRERSTDRNESSKPSERVRGFGVVALAKSSSSILAMKRDGNDQTRGVNDDYLDRNDESSGNPYVRELGRGRSMKEERKFLGQDLSARLIEARKAQQKPQMQLQLQMQQQVQPEITPSLDRETKEPSSRISSDTQVDFIKTPVGGRRRLKSMPLSDTLVSLANERDHRNGYKCASADSTTDSIQIEAEVYPTDKHRIPMNSKASLTDKQEQGNEQERNFIANAVGQPDQVEQVQQRLTSADCIKTAQTSGNQAGWLKALQLSHSTGSYKVRQTDESQQNHHIMEPVLLEASGSEQSSPMAMDESRIEPRKVARIQRPARSPVSLRRQTSAKLMKHRQKIQTQRQEQLTRLAQRARFEPYQVQTRDHEIEPLSLDHHNQQSLSVSLTELNLHDTSQQEVGLSDRILSLARSISGRRSSRTVNNRSHDQQPASSITIELGDSSDHQDPSTDRPNFSASGKSRLQNF